MNWTDQLSNLEHDWKLINERTRSRRRLSYCATCPTREAVERKALG